MFKPKQLCVPGEPAGFIAPPHTPPGGPQIAVVLSSLDVRRAFGMPAPSPFSLSRVGEPPPGLSRFIPDMGVSPVAALRITGGKVS